MSDPTLDVITASSGPSPITAGGTITFQYPDGRARATYIGDGAGRPVLGVRSSQATYQPDIDFTVALNATNIVVTYLAASPIAANVPVSLQLSVRDTSGSPVAASNAFAVPAEVFPAGI